MKDVIDLILRIRAALERRRARWPGHPVRMLYLVAVDHQSWLAAMATGQLPDDLATLSVKQGQSSRLYLKGGQSVVVPKQVPA